MNCKSGDLAVLVRSVTGKNVGRIVTCDCQDRVFWAGTMYEGWITEPELTSVNGARCVVPDAWLRPLRDTDGEDETLTWAGKPEKVTL